MILERRAFEFRAIKDDGAIEGVAVPYGSRGTVGRFSEEFRAGSLSYTDVLCNVSHNAERILARTGAGLTLTETREALVARIELPDTSEVGIRACSCQKRSYEA